MIVIRFRDQRLEYKNKKEFLEKHNLIFDSNLRKSEEEINNKYKIENLNFVEYLDYLDKEVLLEKFL